MARARAQQISFADVELMRQGVRLEPLLEAISKFLDTGCRTQQVLGDRIEDSRLEEETPPFSVGVPITQFRPDCSLIVIQRQLLDSRSRSRLLTVSRE